MKDQVDLATSADLTSEKFIVDFIRSKYPDHSIHSEEAGDIHPGNDYVWIVDPLDGTKEFSRGLSVYNCLVAVEFKGKPVAGAMQRNGVDELYTAMRGCGATLNGLPIHVTDCRDINRASIGIHLPYKGIPERDMSREMNILNSLIRRAYRIRPGWDDANSGVWVARGITDAYIVGPNLPGGWHDVVTALHIVEEAGGKVTDWQGHPIGNHDMSRGIVFSNSVIHQDLLDIISGIQ
jgi:myo-inositol-1(or 4)-monophosphatase